MAFWKSLKRVWTEIFGYFETTLRDLSSLRVMVRGVPSEMKLPTTLPAVSLAWEVRHTGISAVNFPSFTGKERSTPASLMLIWISAGASAPRSPVMTVFSATLGEQLNTANAAAAAMIRNLVFIFYQLIILFLAQNFQSYEYFRNMSNFET